MRLCLPNDVAAESLFALSGSLQGVMRANQPPYTSTCPLHGLPTNVLFHDMHEHPLCSSTRPPAFQYQPQHPSTK